jgi:hypothetical protein
VPAALSLFVSKNVSVGLIATEAALMLDANNNITAVTIVLYLNPASYNFMPYHQLK